MLASLIPFTGTRGSRGVKQSVSIGVIVILVSLDVVMKGTEIKSFSPHKDFSSLIFTQKC